MKGIISIWKFSRPHTIIGSVISIFTLFYIICDEQKISSFFHLIMALIIAITCNVFIVGVNQIADVKIDKINKPYLPIPAGLLSLQKAKIIICSALLISLIFSLIISPFLFGIVALAAAIGWAYSMPPFYLKKHHLSAALAIASVRGLLLNAGGFLVFNYAINDSLEMPENVKILTLFIIVFSVVIAWFKDLPDIAGDAKYNIKTLAIQYSPRVVLIMGNVLVGGAYLFTICMKGQYYLRSEFSSFETKILFFGHLLLMGLFVMNAFSVRLNNHRSIQKFYKRFWWFFFAEYALYLVAYAL